MLDIPATNPAAGGGGGTPAPKRRAMRAASSLPVSSMGVYTRQMRALILYKSHSLSKKIMSGSSSFRKICLSAALCVHLGWCVAAFALVCTLPPTTCAAMYDRFTIGFLCVSFFLYAAMASAAITVPTTHGKYHEIAQAASMGTIMLWCLNMGAVLMAGSSCSVMGSPGNISYIIGCVNFLWMLGLVAACAICSDKPVVTAVAPVPTPAPASEAVALDDFN